MRCYTRPLLNKRNLLFKILNAIKKVKPLCITPKEKMAIEGVSGLYLLLKYIKQTDYSVNVRAHYRVNGYVSAHKRITRTKYKLDVNGLLREAGLDYLIDIIQNQINNLGENYIPQKIRFLNS